MRELLKDIKWSLIVASLLFLFLGIALLIWPHTSNLILCYIVAGVLTAYGLFHIIAYFGKERGSLIGLIVGVILIYESVSDLWSIHRLAKLARSAVVEGEVIDVQDVE